MWAIFAIFIEIIVTFWRKKIDSFFLLFTLTESYLSIFSLLLFMYCLNWDLNSSACQLYVNNFYLNCFFSLPHSMAFIHSREFFSLFSVILNIHLHAGPFDKSRELIIPSCYAFVVNISVTKWETHASISNIFNIFPLSFDSLWKNNF